MPICRVKGCTSTRSNPTVTLHQFPKDRSVRDAWLRFCGCTEEKNLFVCSLHFRTTDYENIFMQNAKKILQKHAVPSIRKPLGESDRGKRASIRNRKKLVADLLEEDQLRCQEAAKYQELLDEVFKPMNPSNWMPTVEDSCGVRQGTGEPESLDLLTDGEARFQETSTFDWLPTVHEACGIVQRTSEPESVTRDLSPGRFTCPIAAFPDHLSMLTPLEDSFSFQTESVLNSTTYEAMDTTGLHLICDAISYSDDTSPTLLTSNDSGCVNGNDSASVPVKRGTIKKIKLDNMNLRKTIRSLRAQLKQKDKLVSALERERNHKAKEIELLRKQIVESSTAPAAQIQAEVDKAFGRIFTQNQTDLILGRKKKVKWTDKEIMLAFALRYHSQSAYKMIRKELKIPLPCLRTLREFASGMNMRCGVLEDVLSVLESSGRFMSPEERVVVFDYDEMSTKQDAELDKRTDSYIGPRKKMQVVAIRGLFAKWKTPIFIDFDRPMSLEILENLISRLHSIGFKVAAIVHDCGGENIGVWKQAGIDHAQNQVSIPHPVTKEEIFFFPDAPHLLKLIRNWLLDHGFFYKGKLITKYFLLELVKKASTLNNPFSKSQAESNNVELNALFKLTMKHVTCEGSERQNVKLAAQLLSHTTAVNLRRHFGQYEEATMLADIIDIINSWFDTMNSSRLHESIPDKQCYGLAEDAQNRNLQRMEELMREIRTLHKHAMPAATHLQIFQKAILTSIQSTRRLLFKMRLDYGISFIMMYKLNQDFLENLFSMIRLNGGHDHPSPMEALSRVRLIILGKSLTFAMSANQNTELNKDIEEHFLMSAIFRKKKETKSNNLDEAFDEDDAEDEPWTFEPRKPNLEELDGQHYVQGYMARSLMKDHDWCGQYTYQLESANVDNVGKENYVEDISRGGLVQPSQEWTQLAEQMENYFNHIHNTGPNKEEPGFRVINNVCQRSIQKMTKKFPDVPLDIVKTFVKKRVNIRIRHLKKKIQEKKLHRFKIMKNNKKAKVGQNKADHSKNQKKMKHFVT